MPRYVRHYKLEIQYFAQVARRWMPSPHQRRLLPPILPHHPLRFPLRLVRLFLASRYATVYTVFHPDVFAQTHGRWIVPNLSSPNNPVPHPQYGIKVETSENAQEVKTARELQAEARPAVPNSSSPNPVPHVRRGVEVDASKIRTARWLREQAGRVVPNSSSPDPMPHDRFGIEDLEVEVFDLRTARWLREQARRVVPNSNSPDQVPHDLVVDENR